VDALAKAGLVEKKSCPGDLRGLEVEVTAQGRRALVRAWPIYRQGIVEHFTRHLTDVECQQLSAILSKIGLP